MKYLNTKHEKNSAKITALIMLILVLLIFVVGPQYKDPPEEYGVAVNFGTTDFGSGNKALSNPKQAEITKQVETSQPKQTESQSEKTASKTEDILTEENPEAIAIKKQKAAEAKAKAEEERIEKRKQEAEAEKKRIETEKKKKLDALIGGVKNATGKDDEGEGPDKDAGNKGQLNGNTYALSYFGGSGPGKGGVGYGLGGRGKPSKQIFKQDCNEYGLVVIRIEVNRNGEVTKATLEPKGSNNTHPCLVEPAKRIAESHKWPADANAPLKQVGFVSINFDVSQ